MTEIVSNGSKWAGEAPDTVDQLLAVMAEHPLDRRFERYGNFAQQYTLEPHIWQFFGNFLTISHVFDIRTDEPEAIAKLKAAIDTNRKRSDYKSQPKPSKRKAA